jgi:ureidoacrylate peracid hydrolase
MTELTFEKDLTALLIVDPFNDFISEGGKLWPSQKQLQRPTTASAI